MLQYPHTLAASLFGDCTLRTCRLLLVDEKDRGKDDLALKEGPRSLAFAAASFMIRCNRDLNRTPPQTTTPNAATPMTAAS